MSDSSPQLQAQDIPIIKIESEPELYTSADDNYFLYCINNSLYSFDLENLTNTQLPSYDPNIGNSAVITAICLSPSKSYAASGFTNGSVQVYDLSKNLSIKSCVKSDFPIKSIVFLNDSMILTVDSNRILNCYKTELNSLTNDFTSFVSNFTKWGKGIKPLNSIFSIELPSPVCQLLPVPTSLSKKESSPFADYICITTEEALYISKINSTPPIKKEDIFIQNANYAVAAFSVQNSHTLLCAYASPSDISLITLSPNGNKVSKIYDGVDELATCVNFISHDTIIVIFSCNNYLIASISESQILQSKMPITGRYLPGINSVFAFGQLTPQSEIKLYKIQTVTFENRMYKYMENENLDGAIDLCRKVMTDGNSPISGLPANKRQRSRVIERTITPLLKQATKKVLSEGNTQKSIEQASFLISLAKEFQMTNWIVSEAVDLFKEANLHPQFVQMIVENDPNASFFTYNAPFVEILLQNHGELDITNFILALQSNVVPPTRLLKYGLETKNSALLAKVYLQKLHDPLRSVMIYARTDYNAVLDVLVANIDKNKGIENSNELIKWIFSSTHNEKLPQCRRIIRAERVDIFNKILVYLSSFTSSSLIRKLPISLNQFINTSFYACSLENVPFTSPIHEFLSKCIVDKSVVLTKTSMKYLLATIFTEDSIPSNSNATSPEFEKKNTNKEAVLVVILSSNPGDKVLDSLLPLCATYQFQNARKQILLSLKKYDVMIKDEIISGKSNEETFSYIRKLIRNAEMNKDSDLLSMIRTAVISNATLLISKDVKSFVDLLLSFTIINEDKMNSSSPALGISTGSNNSLQSTAGSQLVKSDVAINLNQNMPKVTIKDLNEELMKTLNDDSIKHYYLKALFADERVSKTILNNEESLDYVSFLCKYFPSEVRDYISDLNDVSLILKTCIDFQILDACAIIYHKLSNIEESFKCLNDYFDVNLYLFSSNDDSSISTNKKNLEDALKILSDFLSRKVDNAAKYCSMFIKSFVAPLYKIREQKDKCQILCNYLHQVITLSAESMPFDKILEIVVVEFSPLNLGVIRSVLCTIINDYNYDIDTSKSLTILFQQDEIQAQEKYMAISIKGTSYNSICCEICGGLLNDAGGEGVKLFECGHVFHTKCVNKEVCPICHPEERIEQEIVTTTTDMNTRQIFRKLDTFERKLKRDLRA